MRIKKPLNKAQHYIDRDDLLKAVMDYQAVHTKCSEEGRPIPQQPLIIGKYILDLCMRLRTRYNFSQYSYGDLMVGDAIEHCCKAVLKFNYEKMKASKSVNIFNYFTMVAWRAFQFRIIEEKKQNAIKHKHYQHTYRINELQGEQIADASNNEYSNRVIDEYEEKHLNKNVLTTDKKPTKMKAIEVCLKDTKNDIRQEEPLSGSTDSPRPRRGRPKGSKSQRS